jgi:integrase
MSITQDSTTSTRPAKPYPDFPLYAHATGRWAKKIRGQTRFFGPWRDWQAALRTYLADKDDLEAGRRPKRSPTDADALVVQEMVARFLNARRLDVESQALDLRTWKEYEDYGERLIRVFGGSAVVQELGPEDFLKLKADLQRTHKSLVSLKGDIRKIKVFFNWAGPSEKGKNLYQRPLRFGPDFQAPSTKAIKRQLDRQPTKVFSRKQIRRLLAKAGPKLRAMILLGINCGLGNTDCARLTRRRVNLKTGWLHYPRPKTGVERHCPLWPETIEAIQKVWAAKKVPHDPAYRRHVFLTGRRRPFDGTDISHEFRKLADKIKLECSGFYALRHTFATIGSRANLQKALDTIMGDVPPANYMVRSVYDHGKASKSDLRTVVNLVHAWLYPAGTNSAPSSGPNENPSADPPA